MRRSINEEGIFESACLSVRRPCFSVWFPSLVGLKDVFLQPLPATLPGEIASLYISFRLALLLFIPFNDQFQSINDITDWLLKSRGDLTDESVPK